MIMVARDRYRVNLLVRYVAPRRGNAATNRTYPLQPPVRRVKEIGALWAEAATTRHFGSRPPALLGRFGAAWGHLGASPSVWGLSALGTRGEKHPVARLGPPTGHARATIGTSSSQAAVAAVSESTASCRLLMSSGGARPRSIPIGFGGHMAHLLVPWGQQQIGTAVASCMSYPCPRGESFCRFDRCPRKVLRGTPRRRAAAATLPVR